MAINKNPTTLMEAVRHFDADTAARYIARIKWPGGPCCPKCGSVNVGTIKTRNRHQCREKQCRRQFSLLTGTIMEGTHLRLDQWVVAVWMIVACRNGISSCEIARTIGCKQQSAWHLIHRVRHILGQSDAEPMRGTVEADSTWVGGIVKNMPHRRRAKFSKRGPHFGKTSVHAVRERQSGRVQAEVIWREKRAQVQQAVTRNVERGSRLYTDASKTYAWATHGRIRPPDGQPLDRAVCEVGRECERV